MKTKGFLAAATALSMLMGASAFADSRHRDETRDRYESNRSVTMEGRVQRLSRERDGYRVTLDRGGESYFVPASALRRGGRALDLRVGVSVRFYGTYDSRGYVNVSSCDWLDDDGGYYGNDGYRNDGYRNDGSYRGGREAFVSGVIDRVDDRRGVAELRDGRSRQRITIVMRRGDDRRNRGIDLNDLRRGDAVTFAGSWGRNGVFEAWRIDSVNSRR